MCVFNVVFGLGIVELVVQCSPLINKTWGAKTKLKINSLQLISSVTNDGCLQKNNSRTDLIGRLRTCPTYHTPRMHTHKNTNAKCFSASIKEQHLNESNHPLQKQPFAL